jgi:hypothetical protein
MFAEMLRKMNTRYPTIPLILAFVLLFGLAVPAWGQEGDDEPPVPVNQYGTPDMDDIELTLEYTYDTECVAACVETPLGDTGLYLTYDVYADNYGNTWVVPDPVTILYTTIYPEALPPGLASNGGGWTYGSLGVGIIEACGGLEGMGVDVQGFHCDIDPNEDPLGYLGAYFDAHVIEGGHWDFMGQLWETLAAADSLPLWQLAIIYGDDPFDPTDDPNGTATPQASSTPFPTGRPTPTPQPTRAPLPTPPTCPPESISQQQPPAMILIESHPPNPVVVGQGGQGLDVTVRAVSYPVIHRWWTREPEFECQSWDDEVYGVPHPNDGQCSSASLRRSASTCRAQMRPTVSTKLTMRPKKAVKASGTIKMMNGCSNRKSTRCSIFSSFSSRLIENSARLWAL